MRRIPIGRSEELQERGAIRFRIERLGVEAAAFAIRVDGEPRAFVNVCTHRALELDLGEGTFFTSDGALLRCRAHGALYHPLDGSCAGGVCAKGASLTPIPLWEIDGILYAGSS